MLLKFSILLIYFFSPIFGGELSEQLYEPLTSGFMCFRRFNATHEFGCASPDGGSSGVLERVNSKEELANVIGKPPLSRIVLVLPDWLLTKETFLIMRNARKSLIAGVIATMNSSESYPIHMSFDDTCPNNRASLYGLNAFDRACLKSPWNPSGSSLLFHSVNFPLFLLTNSSEIQRLYDCIETYNLAYNSWPKCSAKLLSFMQGGGNSEICLRRQHSEFHNVIRQFTGSAGGLQTCDAIRGDNLLMSTAAPSDEERPSNSVLLVVLRSDALSLFSKVTPSASFVASSFTVISSSTFIISKFTSAFQLNSTKEIVFVAVDAESIDYVGSSAFSEALLSDKISIGGRLLNGSHIYGVAEIGQLGNLALRSPVYIHIGPNTTEQSELVTLFETSLNSTSVSVITVPWSSGIPLPPSSLHAIIRRFSTNNINVPTLLIADYKSSYKTQYYHSHRDTVEAMAESDFLQAAQPISFGLALAFCAHLEKGVTPASLVKCSNIVPNINDADTSQYINDTFFCFAGNCSAIVARNDSQMLQYFPSSGKESQDSPYSSGFNAKHIPGWFDYYVLAAQQIVWPSSTNFKKAVRTSVGFLGTLMHGTIGRALPLNSTATEEECYNLFKSQFGDDKSTPAGAIVYQLADDSRSCVYSSTWLQKAVSPLFSDLDSGIPSRSAMTNSQDSSWTESFWDGEAGKLSLFLTPDPDYENALLAVGIVILIISLVVALFIYRVQKLANTFGNAYDLTLNPQSNGGEF